ncbi:hypothetical protein EV359DRAFT_87142 [Lentinula novae-zelandiae]|nr:hypothetical protein EV359DRAFT_87142 [Lentinula novae-zelandiae]
MKGVNYIITVVSSVNQPNFQRIHGTLYNKAAQPAGRLIFPLNLPTMRSKTTSVTHKYRAQTPDRTSKYQLTGPSPRPHPHITSVASTLTTHMESLALDYEEPIVIPNTPPLMNAPGLSDSKNTLSPSILGFKDKDIGMFTRIKIDEPSELNNFEPEICLQLPRLYEEVWDSADTGEGSLTRGSSGAWVDLIEGPGGVERNT